MKIIGKKVYQRKAPRMIRYEIRQKEYSRGVQVLSSPMWQVAASQIEAVVAQFPGYSVVKDPTIPDRYMVYPSKSDKTFIPVECKPTRL